MTSRSTLYQATYKPPHRSPSLSLPFLRRSNFTTPCDVSCRSSICGFLPSAVDLSALWNVTYTRCNRGVRYDVQHRRTMGIYSSHVMSNLLVSLSLPSVTVSHSPTFSLSLFPPSSLSVFTTACVSPSVERISRAIKSLFSLFLWQGLLKVPP